MEKRAEEKCPYLNQKCLDGVTSRNDEHGFDELRAIHSNVDISVCREGRRAFD